MDMSSGWCRCGSERSQSACSRPRAVLSSPAPSTRSPGVVAIAIERAQFLEERKAGELTRQSEQLKTALLASLGHDLRTPLTAIRIAASNIKASELARDERLEQSDLILSEVERLTRLFQNLLEMARIDAGAIATESRWTHPSEIVAAARDQVEQALQGHTVDVTIEPDVPVRLDPRLTATALAHLLENAAQYSPPGSVVHVTARVGQDGLVIQVRDHGSGIAPADLPHLFERFYRGAAAKSRTSGTGMGLWIARGLLAVENGRVWAENCAEGGAQFTLAVPVAVQDTDIARLHRYDHATLANSARRRRGRPSNARLGRCCALADTRWTSPAPGQRRSTMFARADASAHRARSRLAGSRRNGSVSPRSSDLPGADHRVVGARSGGGQGQRARSWRRRLRDQTVRSRGTAGAHSRGAAADRCGGARPKRVSFRAGALTIDYDRRRVVREGPRSG